MVRMLARRTRSAVVVGCLVCASCAWCGWASAFARGTRPAWVTWLASLAAVVLGDLATARRRARLVGGESAPQAVPDVGERVARGWPEPDAGPHRLARGVAPWIALVTVVTAWEVLGLDTGRHEAHLTLSALSQAYRPIHAASLLAWMALGAGFAIARVRRPRAPTDRASRPELALLLLLRSSGRRHDAVLALLEPDSRPVGIAFWAAVALAVVALDWYGRRSSGRVPGVLQLLRLVSSSRIGTSLVVAAWVVAGWHLFAH